MIEEKSVNPLEILSTDEKKEIVSLELPFDLSSLINPKIDNNDAFGYRGTFTNELLNRELPPKIAHALKERGSTVFRCFTNKDREANLDVLLSTGVDVPDDHRTFWYKVGKPLWLHAWPSERGVYSYVALYSNDEFFNPNKTSLELNDMARKTIKDRFIGLVEIQWV